MEIQNDSSEWVDLAKSGVKYVGKVLLDKMMIILLTGIGINFYFRTVISPTLKKYQTAETKTNDRSKKYHDCK